MLVSIEGVVYCVVFVSGMSVVDVVLCTLEVGDYVVCLDDVYGGVFCLYNMILVWYGLLFIYVDSLFLEWVVEVICLEIKMVWIEILINFLFKVSDVKVLVDVVHVYNIFLVVDLIFVIFVLLCLLEWDVDIVMYLMIKYFSGHN